VASFSGVPIYFAFFPPAEEDQANVEQRLALADRYNFGWDLDDPTHGGKISEWDVQQLKDVAELDERARAARKLGVSKAELKALDKQVLRECGRYP
jgi:hypothetical protein